MRNGLKYDHEGIGQLERDHRLIAGRKLQGLDDKRVNQQFKTFLRKIDAGAPIDLAEVFRRGELVRVVSCDAAYA